MRGARSGPWFKDCVDKHGEEGDSWEEKGTSLLLNAGIARWLDVPLSPICPQSRTLRVHAVPSGSAPLLINKYYNLKDLDLYLLYLSLLRYVLILNFQILLILFISETITKYYFLIQIWNLNQIFHFSPELGSI